MLRGVGWVGWAGVGCLVWGCGGAAKPPEEPKINPDTVPSLALLAGSNIRGEEVSSSGTGESCEAVSTAERERALASGAAEEEAPEEHATEITHVLNQGHYLNDCQLPERSGVELCVAVIDGEARGVTVSLRPGTHEQAACIANQIRRLSFPSHALVSIARTEFEPSR